MRTVYVSERTSEGLPSVMSLKKIRVFDLARTRERALTKLSVTYSKIISSYRTMGNIQEMLTTV